MSLDTSISRYIIGTNLFQDTVPIERLRKEKREAYEVMSSDNTIGSERNEASRRWEELDNLISRYEQVDAERQDLTQKANNCSQEEIPVVRQLINEAYDDLVTSFQTAAFKEEDDAAIISIKPQDAGRGQQTRKDIEAIEDMYFSWFNQQGWDFELFSENPKSLEAGVVGPHALGWLRSMTGITKVIHRDGQPYTNRYSTEVIEQTPQYETVVSEADVEEEFFKGSTSGGQRANSSETNVRLTHEPTGLQARVTGRHREANRNNARKILEGKVKDYYQEDKERKGVNNTRLLSVDLRYPTVGDDVTGKKYSGRRAEQILGGDLAEIAMRRVVYAQDDH